MILTLALHRYALLPWPRRCKPFPLLQLQHKASLVCSKWIPQCGNHLLSSASRGFNGGHTMFYPWIRSTKLPDSVDFIGISKGSIQWKQNCSIPSDFIDSTNCSIPVMSLHWPLASINILQSCLSNKRVKITFKAFAYKRLLRSPRIAVVMSDWVTSFPSSSHLSKTLLTDCGDAARTTSRISEEAFDFVWLVGLSVSEPSSLCGPSASGRRRRGSGAVLVRRWRGALCGDAGAVLVRRWRGTGAASRRGGCGGAGAVARCWCGGAGAVLVRRRVGEGAAVLGRWTVVFAALLLGKQLIYHFQLLFEAENETLNGKSDTEPREKTKANNSKVFGYNMDSNGQTSSGDQFDAKGAFRRLSTDTTNRKYRRRSPVGGSASADEGQMMKGIQVETGDSRPGAVSHVNILISNLLEVLISTLSMMTIQDLASGKNEDNDDRYYSKSSSHSLRDSRGKHYSDHSRRDNDHRSRDYARHVDRHYRDKYDNLAHRSRDKEREASYPESRKHKNRDTLSDRIGSGRMHTTQERGRYKEYRESQDEKSQKTDHRMDFGDHKRHAYEESRGCHDESISTDTRELGVEKYIKEDKKEFDARNNLKEQCAKGSKFYTIDEETNRGEDVLKATTFADEKQSSTSKHDEVTLEQGVKDSDIDAAKVAAMKAAELVNRNLIGTGYMTADQKKKLLWGSKKSTTNSEEGVKGNMKMEQKPGTQDAEKQKELQMDLEKQYTAGLRRRDGRTVGLGL
nr:arginine/serine-rich coiled-coil protein 2 isoform X2 [Ipomoea batatas]